MLASTARGAHPDGTLKINEAFCIGISSRAARMPKCTRHTGRFIEGVLSEVAAHARLCALHVTVPFFARRLRRERLKGVAQPGNASTF